MNSYYDTLSYYSYYMTEIWNGTPPIHGHGTNWPRHSGPCALPPLASWHSSVCSLPTGPTARREGPSTHLARWMAVSLVRIFDHWIWVKTCTKHLPLKNESHRVMKISQKTGAIGHRLVGSCWVYHICKRLWDETLAAYPGDNSNAPRVIVMFSSSHVRRMRQAERFESQSAA
jgi:hypothetical protein